MWTYGFFDYDPATDGDEEAWARAVAAEGWRTWHPTGVLVTVRTRRVRRLGAASAVHAPLVGP